jgi:hypothetical protein
MTEGQAGVAHSQPVTAVLPALDPAGLNALFGDVSERLAALYAAETEALAKLQTAL